MYIITLNSVFFFAQKDLIYIRYCLLLISYKMDPPSNVPFPTGSRVRITCKYCGHAMERRNLKSHTTRVHAGFTPAERPSTKQGMLSFPVSTIKRPLPGNNNGESSKKAWMEDGNDMQENITDVDKGLSQPDGFLFSKTFQCTQIFLCFKSIITIIDKSYIKVFTENLYLLFQPSALFLRSWIGQEAKTMSTANKDF